MSDQLFFSDRSAFLTRKQVAKRLDISLTKLSSLVREGKLHPIRQGRWMRFSAEDVRAYVEVLMSQAGLRLRKQARRRKGQDRPPPTSGLGP